MRLRFKEAYQGWAAKKLGGFPTERVEKGVCDVEQAFADYMLKTFPHLVEVVKTEAVAEEAAPKRGRPKSAKEHES